jgi:membrane protease YdiL (CAAX protease family)
MNVPQGPTSSLFVVKLLLRAALKRSKARSQKQKQLMGNRRARAVTTNWNVLGWLLAVLIAAVFQVIFAFATTEAANLTQKIIQEEKGIIVVRSYRMGLLENAWESYTKASDPEERRKAEESINYNLEEIANPHYESHSKERIQERVNVLWKHLETKGLQGFMSEDDAIKDPAMTRMPAVDWMITFFIIWYGVVLAFQGEGMELDMTRRRYPMWEWLASHPISPKAWFLAEMIMPMVANPLFISVPIYWVGLFWWFHGSFKIGLMAGFLVGIPFALALSCVGKTLETWCMLRLSVRTRGAILGTMAWLGYASFMLMILLGIRIDRYDFLLRPWVPWLSAPIPWIGWMFGAGSGSWVSGVLVCWVAIALLLVVVVFVSARATNRGLAGNEAGSMKPEGTLRKAGASGLMKDPYRAKEILWLKRDRSALVQIFLIPLTMAMAQSYNLGNLTSFLDSTWASWSGACVLVGTYLLYMLGPRSLVTEGAALWIPMTWPRSLEELLLAKARLWSRIAAGIVYAGLGMIACVFPASCWKILLVGIGWHFFGSSFAKRAVTLVRSPSSSGEPEPVPTGQRMAVLLGMTSFSVGVMTENWSVAVIGILYSSFASAAIWQGFRERLPFLFDPWSEKLPKPPTLVHAMVAVCALIELMAICHVFVQMTELAEFLKMAICYGISGTVVCAGTIVFLRRREVSLFQIWRWSRDELAFTWASALKGYGLALVIGGGLGMIGYGYSWTVTNIPWLHELAKQAVANDSFSRDEKFWLYMLTVGMAPLAEEYLFRGLFFRALDREWGGWRALAGGAAFFAIYHPVVSWIPVAVLGLVNCWLYKKTGRLSCCVIVHMVYNAIVVSAASAG